MKISTLFVIVGMIIISLYALVEVNYYSAIENVSKHPGETPYLEIPKLGIDESINNKSIDYGIYYEPKSAKPGSGTTVLFGHRTLHGSPFLKLDQLKPEDNITVDWKGIGDVEYIVENTTIVPADYRLSIDQGNSLFLITCYPLGSTKERLIIKAKQMKIYPTYKEKKTNPQRHYAVIIILAFMTLGTVLSFLYPIAEDRGILLLVTLALTLFLTLGYFFPVPPSSIETNLSRLNEFLGV